MAVELQEARARLIGAIARSPHRARLLEAWERLLRSELPTQPVVAPPRSYLGRRRRLLLKEVRAALARSGGNTEAAARAIGCSRWTIYRILRTAQSIDDAS